MLHDEDEKYLQIREKLRSLPRVKASDNFMVSLQHKINLVDAEARHLGSTIHKQTHERLQQGTLSRFFGFQQRPWLIPSLSFTVVIFLVLIAVYFGYFNTSGTDMQTSNNSPQTITQNSGVTGNTNNTNSTNTQQPNSGNNTGTAQEKIGNTDSQPGNDEGLLATNDDKLGKTDSYNNRSNVNVMNKLPVTETSRSISNEETETMTAEPPANTEEMKINSSTEKPGMVGTTIDGGRTKAAMRPFDENSGISVDEKKKDSSKNPRNIREVISIGKTDLEELIDALNGE
ncbi:MAG TPA: hypothetical protein VHP32_03015 [Ignavibacteria bacterium]|nr:hypothetical protein [Ignavibacteria bacterium]